eukprot:2458131-Rhodomonas_salina.1
MQHRERGFAAHHAMQHHWRADVGLGTPTLSVSPASSLSSDRSQLVQPRVFRVIEQRIHSSMSQHRTEHTFEQYVSSDRHVLISQHRTDASSVSPEHLASSDRAERTARRILVGNKPALSARTFRIVGKTPGSRADLVVDLHTPHFDFPRRIVEPQRVLRLD